MKTRLAFSTVACPDWTLERVARIARETGFDGVELRTNGPGGAEFACDPALTAGEKLQQLFSDEGVEVAGVATGLRYDALVHPPVIGYALPGSDAAVQATKPVIDIAVSIGAPYVRIFAFQKHGRESIARARRRIVDRLVLAAAAARHMGVQLLLENGGSFPRAEDVASLIDEVDSPHMAACYALHAAASAGEDPTRGVRTLGFRLRCARIKDLREGRPCPLGAGELPCREFAQAVRDSSSAAWLVYEWDKAWLPDIAQADEVLPAAARTLFAWTAQGVAAARAS